MIKLFGIFLEERHHCRSLWAGAVCSSIASQSINCFSAVSRMASACWTKSRSNVISQIAWEQILKLCHRARCWILRVFWIMSDSILRSALLGRQQRWNIKIEVWHPEKLPNKTAVIELRKIHPSLTFVWLQSFIYNTVYFTWIPYTVSSEEGHLVPIMYVLKISA